jgi:hypothetical protein
MEGDSSFWKILFYTFQFSPEKDGKYTKISLSENVLKIGSSEVVLKIGPSGVLLK